jgi:hypothetical protein
MFVHPGLFVRGEAPNMSAASLQDRIRPFGVGRKPEMEQRISAAQGRLLLGQRDVPLVTDTCRAA